MADDVPGHDVEVFGIGRVGGLRPVRKGAEVDGVGGGDGVGGVEDLRAELDFALAADEEDRVGREFARVGEIVHAVVDGLGLCLEGNLAADAPERMERLLRLEVAVFDGEDAERTGRDDAHELAVAQKADHRGLGGIGAMGVERDARDAAAAVVLLAPVGDLFGAVGERSKEMRDAVCGEDQAAAQTVAQMLFRREGLGRLARQRGAFQRDDERLVIAVAAPFAVEERQDVERAGVKLAFGHAVEEGGVVARSLEEVARFGVLQVGGREERAAPRHQELLARVDAVEDVRHANEVLLEIVILLLLGFGAG